MDNALKLRVVFDMIDNMTKPLKNILAGNKGLATALKQTRGELSGMAKTQRTVGEFREIRSGLAATASKLNGARGNIKELAAALRASGPPSRQMIADFEKAKQSASRLSIEHEKQSARVRELRDQLAAAGVNTRNLSQHERDLRGSIASTTATMNDQMRKLEAIGEREKRIASARRSMEKMQGVAAGMAVGGYAARSTGTHVLGDLRESLDESKNFEREAMRIKALGLGDHASADAVKYARAMKQYGVATTDNVLMMRDALSIFADEHHAQMVMPTLAKMKFANDSMYGSEDAHSNEEKFMNMLKVIELRGGTKSEATFKDEANMVQKVLTATGGRVGGDQWRDFIQTGGVAAKQMRKDAFYYQMEPLIQEMGGHAVGTGLMSAYSNAYQGKTTVRAAKQMMELNLLDPKMVEYTKIGTIKRIKPGALAGGDQFKASPLEWIEKVLLPKLNAKGITDPDKVKDMISTIFTNRTAANLFTTMYMQRDQIHKNERMNAGADGIDEAAAKGEQLTQGREIAALARLRDLKLEIGEKISPLYNSALQATAAATAKVVGFMKEHSAAAKVILSALAALAAILVVCGTMTIALAGVLGPLAVVKFSMQTLGLQGGLLARGLRLCASALRMLGTTAMFAGRAMLMNPIGLAITAAVAVIAGAAYLIYRYWTPVTTFFARVWEGTKEAFSSAAGWIAQFLMNWTPIGFIAEHWNDLRAITIASWALIKSGIVTTAHSVADFFMNWTLVGLFIQHWDTIRSETGIAWDWITGTAIKAGQGIADFFMNWTLLGTIVRHWDGIKAFMSQLVGRFTTIGGQIIDGMASGILGRMNAVRAALHNVGENAINWFKEKLGIHSPSRVFAELGGFVAHGAASGIDGGRDRVAKAAVTLATVATTAFGIPQLAHVARAATVPLVRPTVPIDTRPPVAAAAAVPAATAARPTQYIINIYPQGNSDAQAIARAVAVELDRRESAQRARRVSSLSDS